MWENAVVICCKIYQASSRLLGGPPSLQGNPADEPVRIRRKGNESLPNTAFKRTGLASRLIRR